MLLTVVHLDLKNESNLLIQIQCEIESSQASFRDQASLDHI